MYPIYSTLLRIMRRPYMWDSRSGNTCRGLSGAASNHEGAWGSSETIHDGAASPRRSSWRLIWIAEERKWSSESTEEHQSAMSWLWTVSVFIVCLNPTIRNASNDVHSSIYCGGVAWDGTFQSGILRAFVRPGTWLAFTSTFHIDSGTRDNFIPFNTILSKFPLKYPQGTSPLSKYQGYDFLGLICSGNAFGKGRKASSPRTHHRKTSETMYLICHNWSDVWA